MKKKDIKTTFFHTARYSACVLFTWLGMSDSTSAAIRFENPLKDQGSLSHQLSGINTILQDHHGFIWLGGESGLGRYDGSSIKLYQSQSSKSNALPSNFIWQLALDHDNMMWIATEGGLSRYDSATDSFERLHGIGDVSFAWSSISALAVDHKNQVYIGAWQGLYRVSADRKHMDLFLPNPPVARAPNGEQVREITIAPDGKLWLATAGMGVAIFDPETETFDYLIHDPDEANSLAYDSVKTIEIDRNGRVWIGTYGGGMSVYNPDSGNFRHYPFDPGDEGGLQSAVVWDIYEDSEGVLWVSLDQGGLARYDETSDTFEHFLHHPYDPSTVASNQLRFIFEDSNTDLWVGAFPSGVSFYNRSKQLFETHTAKPGEYTSLTDNAITSLFQDSEGTIWVGTEGGLNKFNPADGTFTQYRANPRDPHSLNANPILAINEDVRGNLWVGTWAGGLHRFERDTQKFYRYLPDEDDPGSIGCKFIWDILEDSENNLWIATETGGLNRYHPETDSFSSYQHQPQDETSISGNFIWTFMESRQGGQLWLGGFTGLDLFDRASERFHQFPHGGDSPKSVSSKNIRSLYEDSRGLVWVGTQERGVSIYHPEDGTFQHLDVGDGLPSSSVSSILEDNNGDMWLATTNGLAQIKYDTLNITTYSKHHGLAGSNFNRNASLKDRNGNLYFGSTEGLTIFNPDNLTAQTGDYPIRLTGFRILNDEVPIGPASPLKQSITSAKAIRLSHKDSMFSFDFAALNYRNAFSTRYAYKLEGFDRDWNYINTQSTATYTNIDPGTYSFQVKAASGNSDWQEGPTLKVVIDAPPWRSWWAYLAYAGILGAAVYYRSEHRRLRRSAEIYKTQSITDPLTELYNRAGISQAFNTLFAEPDGRQDVAVMLMDIDYFKRINDLYGHHAGDKVLKDIAKLVRLSIRRSDYFGRWGGEEFVLICPATPTPAAGIIAEKIRTAIASYVFDADNTPMGITVSIGVAITRPEDDFDSALKRADIALYKAKAIGRNCVYVADSDLVDQDIH